MRRKFSKEEKLAAIQALEQGETVLLNLKMVRRWRDEFLKYGSKAFTGYGNMRVPKPQKTERLVCRFTPNEYHRFIERARLSGATKVSKFARARLFELAPDPKQIEQRIAVLAEAIERLAQAIAKA